MKKIFLFISSFLFSMYGIVLCAEQQVKQPSSSLYPELARLYLPALDARTAAQSKEEKQRRITQQKAMKTLEKQLKDRYRGGGKEAEAIAQVNFILQYPQNRPSLLETELFECAYEMFDQSDKNGANADKSLLADRLRAIRDLSIFSGETGDEANNVFDKLNRTQTVFGAITLQHDLLDLNKSQAEIKQQQNIVKSLLQRPNLMKKIDSFLEQIKGKQQGLLEAWNTIDRKRQSFQNLLYPSGNDYINPPSVPWSADMEKKLLESPLYLECRSWDQRLIDCLVACIGGTESLATYQGIKGLVRGIIPPSLLGLVNILLLHVWQLLVAPGMWGVFVAAVGTLLVTLIFFIRNVIAIKNSDKEGDANKSWIGLMISGSIGLCALMVAFLFGFIFILGRVVMGKIAYDKAKAMDRITNWIHTTMNDWSCFVKSFEGLWQEIEKEKELASLLSEGIGSETVGQYWDILKRDDVAQSPTFWSAKGHMLWINKALMDGGKDLFIPSFKMLGRIDACMSIAKLMKESEARNTGKFCFVEFADQQLPYIDVRDMWHANLDPAKVVSNSVMLDAQNGPVGFVVTGPNTGGKTTYVKALATGLFLRNWGIFPGSYAKITDFKYIETVMNTRDKAGMSSSFEAQLQNVNHVLEVAKKANEEKDGNYFMLFDESLNATNAEEGGSLAYAMLEYLATLRGGFVVSTSHHRQTTDVAKKYPQWFKNLKVEAIPNLDPATKATKPYTYPYTIKEGVSDQFIAIDLAQAQGSIGSSIALSARAKLLEFLQSNAVDKNMLAKVQAQVAY